MRDRLIHHEAVEVFLFVAVENSSGTGQERETRLVDWVSVNPALDRWIVVAKGRPGEAEPEGDEHGEG